MKKHIKKIICLVAVLVLCTSALVVPCFAYTQYDYDTSDLIGANLVTPEVVISNRLSSTRYVDTFPNYLFDNSYNDLDSNAWYVDELAGYENVPNVTYGVFGLVADRYDSTAVLNFPTYAVRTDNINAYYQYEFTGYFKFNLDVVFYGDGGQFDEVHYQLDYTNETDLTWWKLGDLMPTNLPSGTMYVTITNFEIVRPSDFFLGIPYYYANTLAELPIQHIDTDNFMHPVYVDSVNVGDFLFNSVKNFLDFEIVDGLSLYVVFICIVAMLLLVWFLKLLAGG